MYFLSLDEVLRLVESSVKQTSLEGHGSWAVQILRHTGVRHSAAGDRVRPTGAQLVRHPVAGGGAHGGTQTTIGCHRSSVWDTSVGHRAASCIHTTRAHFISRPVAGGG